ncbi:MAG: trypsin-like peptidase domain-containing protein [Spirochaetales bacterium]|nr:trypsin-like peptidase domain-containing protein [Spirochaetales bacterium]
MKLYSRRELFFAIVASVLAVLLVVVLLFPLQRGEEDRMAEEEPILADNSVRAISDPPEGKYTTEELLNIDLYERLNEGVVNINTTVMSYNFFLEPIPREGASGSGSIISEEGYVLTNYHVVEGARQVYITLADGGQYEGRVIGTDLENDLAIVKFDPAGKELTVIPFGTSENLKVGQKVLAIGNPYGLERTMSTGIVSAPGRPIKNDDNLIIRDMIQTDASINPGNSGGPLLNTCGEMIGITTLIYSPSGGSVGIGFSVPIDTARRVVPDLIEYGRVQRGWIDIDPIQLFPNLVRYGDLPIAEGILISSITSGSPAEEAGLRGGSKSKAVRINANTIIYLGGDIIVGIDGKNIADYSDFYSALEDTRPGDKVKVTVVRGRRTLDFEVTLTERPEGRL